MHKEYLTSSHLNDTKKMIPNANNAQPILGLHNEAFEDDDVPLLIPPPVNVQNVAHVPAQAEAANGCLSTAWNKIKGIFCSPMEEEVHIHPALETLEEIEFVLSSMESERAQLALDGVGRFKKVAMHWHEIVSLLKNKTISPQQKNLKILELTRIQAHIEQYPPEDQAKITINTFDTILTTSMQLRDEFLNDLEQLLQRFTSTNTCLQARHATFFDLNSAAISAALAEPTRDDCLGRLVLAYREINPIFLPAAIFRRWITSELNILGKVFEDGILDKKHLDEFIAQSIEDYVLAE